MYKVTASVFTPPHVFRKTVVGHIPAGVLEQGQRDLCNPHVLGDLGSHKIVAHERSLPVVLVRALAAAYLEWKVFNAGAVEMFRDGLLDLGEAGSQIVLVVCP